MTDVVLIGGRWDGCRFGIIDTPPRIQMGEGGLIYERIDDPDTGEFLGGYALAREQP